MAASPAAEPFSIRGFASRMRAVDATKCWPFLRGEDGDPPLPPMEPPKRSRWWAHELAAERARLEVLAMGRDAAAGGGGGVEGGGGLPKGSTKRKGSRGTAGAERAKRRRLALQVDLHLKHKEKISKPQSTSRLLQHVLHMGLLKKHQNSTVHAREELAVRKKFQDTHDHLSTHGSSSNKQFSTGTDPSSDMYSSRLFRRKAAKSSVHKKGINVGGPTNHPLDPGCDVVKHFAYPPNDDIFGDLPLLESSKIIFPTGVDELPAVIEDSFITHQNGADAITENVPLKLMPPSNIPAQTPCTLEGLKKEVTPDKRSTCISHNDATMSRPSSVEFDGRFNIGSINLVETRLGDFQLKSTDAPALSSYSNEGLKSGWYSMNTNCCQEIKKPGVSSGTSSVAVGTRTEATKRNTDAAASGKKNTNISGPIVPDEYFISSEGSVMSSTITQQSASAGTNPDVMSSCRRIHSKDSIPTSSRFGHLASNVCHTSRKSVDTCTSSAKEDQGSWYSKHQPVGTPASVGLAFMKLPGLERIEISSGNPRTVENRSSNGQPIVRCQKQQLMSGVTNIMHDKNKVGFSGFEAREKVPDGYLRQGVYHASQPTVRLMGKTVSVCKRSKEHMVSTVGKVWTDSTEDYPLSLACPLPDQRLFPCHDFVIPRAHINEPADVSRSFPNSTLPEARATIGNVQNNRLHLINSVSSTVKDHVWNNGSQFIRQAEVQKTSISSANSGARHLNLHQPPQVLSFPQNKHAHLSTPASSTFRENHSIAAPTVNGSSFPQWMLNKDMQGKHKKSTLFSYGDPSSAPIRQSCQVPRAKLSSTPVSSFLDYGRNIAEFGKSSPGVCPSLTPSLASNYISTVSPTCTASITNLDVNMDSAFIDQRWRPVYLGNVSQGSAKKQLHANKHDLAKPMLPDMKSHSLGWSLDDAVGPRVLDFSNKVSGHAMQAPANESHGFNVSSGPVPDFETRSRAARLVTGAKTMLKPGQNLNDLLYSTKFPVDNGINSAVL